MRSISPSQVARCENAKTKRCRCRCQGVFHGAGRIGVGLTPGALRAASLDLPQGDPHRVGNAKPKEFMLNWLDHFDVREVTGIVPEITTEVRGRCSVDAVAYAPS